MGDLSTLIPGGTALGAFAFVIGILIRYLITDRKLLGEADKRYKAEADQHEDTQRQLDEERRLRRKAEDDLAAVAREVGGLRQQIEAQTKQLAAQTQQLAAQTARIAHLETQVAHLTGSAAA